MNIQERLVRLGNHRIGNLEKLFEWSQKSDLIDLECSNTEDIIDNH